jgi:hypothetical protein
MTPKKFFPTGMLRLLLFLTLVTSAHAKSKAGLDMLSFYAGPWITTNDMTGATSKDSYFNTVQAALYYHAWGLQGYVAIPATLTLEKYPDKIKYAFYPTDFKFYFAKKVLGVVPRLGLSFPFGYPTADTLAWTGSRNFKLITGFGFLVGKFFKQRLTIGGETVHRYYLTGLKNGARIGQGSISGYLSAKAGWKLNKKWGIAFELFPYYSYFTETDWDPGLVWKSYGILPLVSCQYKLRNKIHLGAKAGYGKGKSGYDYENNSNVINASISLTLYMW